MSLHKLEKQSFLKTIGEARPVTVRSEGASRAHNDVMVRLRETKYWMRELPHWRSPWFPGQRDSYIEAQLRTIRRIIRD